MLRYRPCHSKVAYLDLAVFFDENILRLQVSVDNVELIQIIQAASEVVHYNQQLLILQVFLLNYKLEIVRNVVGGKKDVLEVVESFLVFAREDDIVQPDGEYVLRPYR